MYLVEYFALKQKLPSSSFEGLGTRSDDESFRVHASDDDGVHAISDGDDSGGGG